MGRSEGQVRPGQREAGQMLLPRLRPGRLLMGLSCAANPHPQKAGWEQVQGPPGWKLRVLIIQREI